MIDFHSHILPCIDDGSKSTEEGVQLIGMLARQGAEIIVATPHYRANHETIDDFIERRQASYEGLRSVLPDDAPKILLGAEVAFYEGISRLPDIKKLCIAGTNLLLIEMPVSKWTQYTVRELEKIALSNGVVIVLAHIERYISHHNMRFFSRLRENGILFQSNASFFLNRFSRRKAFSLLQGGYIQLFGSDCHNLTDRAPRLGMALSLISKKLGKEFTEKIDSYQRSLFS